MWQLTELIAGLPGLLALWGFFIYVNYVITQKIHEQNKNNKVKFIVALRILVLSVMSNDVLPKSNVCVKTESVFSSNL